MPPLCWRVFIACMQTTLQVQSDNYSHQDDSFTSQNFVCSYWSKKNSTVGKKLFILVYKYHIKTPKLFKHQQKLLLLIKKNAHTHYCHSLHHIVNFRVFWKKFVTHSKSKIFFFPISFEPLFILAINKRSHFM